MPTHAPLAGYPWVATSAITPQHLHACDGLILAPGSPYADFDRVLNAIAQARTTRLPFLGICGGFQHVLIEFARSLLGLTDADSAEHGQATAHLVIVPMPCRLEGAHQVEILPDTHLARIHGHAGLQQETYFCGFQADSAYQERFQQAGLLINARAADGTPRGCELPDHPFFLATAFQPQMKPGHPVIGAFLAAAQQHALQAAWSTSVTPEDYEQHMDNIGQAQANAELSARLLQPFPQGRLLVAGAGPGQMLEHGLRLDRFNLTFTDVNAVFLDRLRTRLAAQGFGAEAVLDDLTASQLTLQFDAALIVLVLEHVDWRRALHTLARLATHWLIIIQRNPAGMPTAVTPGVLPPGTMQRFAADCRPHLVPEEDLTAAALGLGYGLEARVEQPVRDGKAMIGLHFQRRTIS